MLSEVEYGRILGSFTAVVEDAAQTEAPDALPLSGSVTFYPSRDHVSYINTAGQTASLYLAPVTAAIRNGKLVGRDGEDGVVLLASNSNNISASVLWTARIKVDPIYAGQDAPDVYDFLIEVERNKIATLIDAIKAQSRVHNIALFDDMIAVAAAKFWERVEAGEFRGSQGPPGPAGVGVGVAGPVGRPGIVGRDGDPGVGGNLIPDGDLEQPGFLVSGDYVETSDAVSGSKAARLSNATSRKIKIEPETSYVGTAYFKSDDNSPVTVSLRVFGSEGDISRVIENTYDLPSDSWRRVTFLLDSDIGDQSMEIITRTDGRIITADLYTLSDNSVVQGLQRDLTAAENQLREAMEQLDKDLELVDSERIRLNESLNDLAAVLEDAEVDLTEVNTQLDDLRNDLDAEETRRQEADEAAQKIMEQLDINLGQAKTDLEANKTIIDNLGTELEESSAIVEESKNKLDVLENTTLPNLKKLLEDADAEALQELAQLNTNLNLAKGDIAEAREGLHELETVTLPELRESIANINTDLQADLTDLAENLDQVRVDLDSNTDIVDNINNEVLPKVQADLVANNEELEQTKRELADESAARQDADQQAQQTLADLDSKLESLPTEEALELVRGELEDALEVANSAKTAANEANTAANAASQAALEAAGIAASKGRTIIQENEPQGADRNAANIWIKPIPDDPETEIQERSVTYVYMEDTDTWEPTTSSELAQAAQNALDAREAAQQAQQRADTAIANAATAQSAAEAAQRTADEATLDARDAHNAAIDAQAEADAAQERINSGLNLVQNPTRTKSVGDWYASTGELTISEEDMGHGVINVLRHLGGSASVWSPYFDIDPTLAYEARITLHKPQISNPVFGSDLYFGINILGSGSSTQVEADRISVANGSVTTPTTNLYFWSADGPFDGPVELVAYILPIGADSALAEGLGNATTVVRFSDPTSSSMRLRWLNYDNSLGDSPAFAGNISVRATTVEDIIRAKTARDAAEAAQARAEEAYTEAERKLSEEQVQAISDATQAAAEATARAEIEAAEARAAVEAARLANEAAEREAGEAEDAAKAYADLIDTGASAADLAAARQYAEEQAEEARIAAEKAAALDATAKAETAESNAAADAKDKADEALRLAKIDATTKADEAKEAARQAQEIADDARIRANALMESGESLIVNGGFEQGALGWEPQGERTFIVETDNAYAGTHVLRLLPHELNTYPYADPVTAATGRTYRISYMVRHDGLHPSGRIRQYNMITKADGTTQGQFHPNWYTASEFEENTWNQVTFDLTVSVEGANSIQFAPHLGVSPNTYDIDEFRVVDITEALAAKNAAEAAQKRADEAYEEASKKLDQSQVESIVVASANGKNAITRAITEPVGNGVTIGDLWVRVDANQDAFAQWYWNGARWVAARIKSDMLEALDVHKLQVTGTAKIKEAVIDKLFAETFAAHKITASELVIASVKSDGTLADGAVSAVTIKDGAVSADKIAAEAVTAGKIAARTISADKIATNSLTANEIAANAITVSELAANSVNASKIVADAITTAKIDAEAVNTAKLAANAVTAAKISSDAIEARHIKANIIDAGKINAESVGAAVGQFIKLNVKDLVASGAAIDSAVIDRIWADGISAKSITASRLAVSSGNIYRDPSLTDPNAFNQTYIQQGGGKEGGGSFLLPGSDSQVGSYDDITSSTGFRTQVEAGRRYRFGVWVRSNGRIVGQNVRVYRRYYDYTGTQIPGTSSIATSEDTPASVWTWVEGEEIAPVGAVEIAIGFYTQPGHNSATRFSNPVLTPLVGSVLIENGAVNASKINAESVGAAVGEFIKLDVKDLTASSANIGSLVAQRIAAGTAAFQTVNADNIVASTATMKSAVIDQIWADGIAAKSIVSQSLVVGPRNVLDANATDDPADWNGSLFYWNNDDLAWVRTGSVAGNNQFSPFPVAVGNYDAHEVEGGREYHMSYEALIGNGTGDGRWAIYYRTSAGTTHFVGDGIEGEGGDTSTYSDIPAGKWTTINRTWKAPATAVSAGFVVQINNVTANAVGLKVRKPYVTIKSGSVLIESGTVSADHLTSNSIDTRHLRSEAITADKIGANQIVAGKIAANAVDTNQLRANAVDADKIAANAVIAGKVAADVISGREIRSRTILAEHIIGGTITSNEIKGRTITAAEILAGTITTNELDVGNITANTGFIDNLWTNGLSAKTFAASRITVTPSNMLAGVQTWSQDRIDGEMDAWSDFGRNTGDPSRWEQGQRTNYVHQPIEFMAGRKYRFSMDIRGSISNTRFYVQLMNSDTQSNPIGGGFPTSVSSSGYIISNQVVSGTNNWNTFIVEFEPTTSGLAMFRFFMNHPNGTSTSTTYQWIKNPVLLPMTSGVLIENGAITTDHMTANTIDGDRIRTNTLTGNRITANSINGDRIIANTLDGNRITANTLSADKISGGSFEGKTFTGGTFTGVRVQATNSGGEGTIIVPTTTRGSGGIWFTDTGIAGGEQAAIYRSSWASGADPIVLRGTRGGGVRVEGGLTTTQGGISMNNYNLAGVNNMYVYQIHPDRINGVFRLVNQPSTSSPANIYSNPLDGTVARRTSSRRYKKNIAEWNPDSHRVLGLRPRQWQHHDPMWPDNIDERWHVGFIAEEVHDLGLYGLVEYDGDGKGGWRPESLNYERFAAAQQIVLQKHESEIKELTSLVSELRAELDELKSRI